MSYHAMMDMVLIPTNTVDHKAREEYRTLLEYQGVIRAWTTEKLQRFVESLETGTMTMSPSEGWLYLRGLADLGKMYHLGKRLRVPEVFPYHPLIQEVIEPDQAQLAIDHEARVSQEIATLRDRLG